MSESQAMNCVAIEVNKRKPNFENITCSHYRSVSYKLCNYNLDIVF